MYILHVAPCFDTISVTVMYLFLPCQLIVDMGECMVGWTNFTVTLQFLGTLLYCRALKIGKDGIKIFTWCFKEPRGSFLKNVNIISL
jgi:hypothetical protein